MGYLEDAKSLVSKGERELGELKKAYERSLSSQNISAELLIDIKNLMENLRSALDYTAHGLFDKYGKKTKTDPKIYFPYALATQSLADFQNSKRVGACLPGVDSSRPDVAQRIEGFQHFAGKSWRWVPIFMDLNNSNKHQQLTPQIRRQSRELRMTFPGGVGISMSEGAKIVIGGGASISSGGVFIGGNQEISVDRPPVMSGGGKSEVITWVSFHFSSNNEPVIPFLTECVTGVKTIVEELSAI